MVIYIYVYIWLYTYIYIYICIYADPCRLGVSEPMVRPVPPNSKQPYTFTTPRRPKQRLSQTPRFSDPLHSQILGASVWTIYMGVGAPALDSPKVLFYVIMLTIHTYHTSIPYHTYGVMLASLPSLSKSCEKNKFDFQIPQRMQQSIFAYVACCAERHRGRSQHWRTRHLVNI